MTTQELKKAITTFTNENIASLRKNMFYVKPDSKENIVPIGEYYLKNISKIETKRKEWVNSVYDSIYFPGDERPTWMIEKEYFPEGAVKKRFHEKKPFNHVMLTEVYIYVIAALRKKNISGSFSFLIKRNKLYDCEWHMLNRRLKYESKEEFTPLRLYDDLQTLCYTIITGHLYNKEFCYNDFYIIEDIRSDDIKEQKETKKETEKETEKEYDDEIQHMNVKDLYNYVCQEIYGNRNKGKFSILIAQDISEKFKPTKRLFYNTNTDFTIVALQADINSKCKHMQREVYYIKDFHGVFTNKRNNNDLITEKTIEETYEEPAKDIEIIEEIDTKHKYLKEVYQYIKDYIECSNMKGKITFLLRQDMSSSFKLTKRLFCNDIDSFTFVQFEKNVKTYCKHMTKDVYYVEDIRNVIN